MPNFTTLWCSRCHAAWYCCPDHLQRDWNKHRLECRPFKPAIPMEIDPQSLEFGTAASFTAILFPYNDERPQLIKVDCLARPQTTGPCKWIPLAIPHVGGTREPGNIVITRGVGGAPLRFPLHIFYRADFLIDGSLPNRAINRLTGGQATHQWNGNVIALKFYGTRRQGYTDAGNGDLAALVAYFMEPRSS